MVRYLKLGFVPFWLPITVLAVTAVRFGRLPNPVNSEFAVLEHAVALRHPGTVAAFHEVIPSVGVAIAVLCAVMWLGALPLSIAVYLLWSRSRALAYAGAAVLGPLNVVTLIGGLDWPMQVSVSLSVTTMRLLPDPLDAIRLEMGLARLAIVIYLLLADSPDIVRYALLFTPVSCSIAFPAWYALAVLRIQRATEATSTTGTEVLRYLRPALLTLWLPLGVLLLMIRTELLTFRDFGGPLALTDLSLALLPPFVFFWLAAFPLSLAAFLLRVHSRALAFVCVVPLAFLTIAFVTSSSMLGSMGTMIFGLVCSIPAWIVLGVTAQIRRGRTNARPAEST